MFPGKYSWAGNISSGDCSINIFHAEREFDHGELIEFFLTFFNKNLILVKYFSFTFFLCNIIRYTHIYFKNLMLRNILTVCFILNTCRKMAVQCHGYKLQIKRCFRNRNQDKKLIILLYYPFAYFLNSKYCNNNKS